jgi:hypothetical protein
MGKCSGCKTNFSTPFVTHQGAHGSAICTWRLKFHTHTISLQSYAGSKQQSYLVMKMLTGKLSIERIEGM